MRELKTCEICGNTSDEIPVYYNKTLHKMLCKRHAGQIYLFGEITNPSKHRERKQYRKNEIIIEGDTAKIKMINKKGEINYAIIDLEDIERISIHCWHVSGTGYAEAGFNKQTVLMHRYILDYNEKFDVDHINRNKLDNRKSNLRIVTRQENAVNKEPGGVCYKKDKKKYLAYVDRYGKRFSAGYHGTYEDARIAWEAKLKEIEDKKEIYEKEFQEKTNKAGKNIRPVSSGRYSVSYQHKGNSIYVGTFDTIEEAKDALLKSKKQDH